MAADGAGSTAVLKQGAALDQRIPGSSNNRDSFGGGMLAENGGKVLVEGGGSLSGHWNSMTVRGARCGQRGRESGCYFGRLLC